MYIFYNFENFILSNGEDYVIKVSFILLLQIISVLTLITFTLFEPLMKINFIRNFSILISTQTYSVYLIHIIFIYLLEKAQLGINNTVFIYIILLFVSSSLIFKFIEKPILQIRPKLH